MQITRNERLIQSRRRIGTYATLAGLAVLVGGMIISFQQQYLYVSLGALLIGFLLSQYGNSYLRRYARKPRPDEVLERGFKGFDDRYRFYSWSLPAPYVLLSPQGVFTFIIRDQAGKVSVQGSRWHSRLTLARVLTIFAQEGIGNPTREALDTAARLDQWMEGTLPHLALQVQPAIVFVDERAQLDINEPTVPVLEPKSLKKWLRGANRGQELPAADYRAIQQLFDNKAGLGDTR